MADPVLRLGGNLRVMGGAEKKRKRDASVKKTKKGATHVGPMEIKYERPPIWDRAIKAFGPLPGAIFCWGAE